MLREDEEAEVCGGRGVLHATRIRTCTKTDPTSRALIEAEDVDVALIASKWAHRGVKLKRHGGADSATWVRRIHNEIGRVLLAAIRT